MISSSSRVTGSFLLRYNRFQRNSQAADSSQEEGLGFRVCCLPDGHIGSPKMSCIVSCEKHCCYAGQRVTVSFSCSVRALCISSSTISSSNGRISGNTLNDKTRYTCNKSSSSKGSNSSSNPSSSKNNCSSRFTRSSKRCSKLKRLVDQCWRRVAPRPT